MGAPTPDLPTPVIPIEDSRAILEGIGKPERAASKPLSVETIDAPAWFDTFRDIQKGELPRRGFTVGKATFNDEVIKELRATVKVVGGEKDQGVLLGLSATMDYSDVRLEKDAGFTPTGDAVKIAKNLREQGNTVKFETTSSGQQAIILEKDGVRCMVNLGWSSLQEKPKSDFGDPTSFFNSRWRDLMGKNEINGTPPIPEQPKTQNNPIVAELVSLKDNATIVEIANRDDMTKQAQQFTHMLGEFTTAYYQARGITPPENAVNFQIPNWENYVGDDPSLAAIGKMDKSNPFSKMFGEKTEQIGYLLTEEEKAAMPKFADIGGNPQAVDEARKLVMAIKHADVYAQRGVTRPKGILLEGPPGTGKTMLAKAIASEAGTEFMSLSVTDIISKWVGDAEKHMQEFFDRAKALADQGKDVITFIDEVDSLVPSRDSNIHEVTQKMVAVFLQNMDGLKANPRLTILASTNRPEALDQAFMRPGRLDKKIHIGLPDETGRAQILKIHLQKHLEQSGNKDNIISPDLDVDSVAKTLGNVSGADIAGIVNLALEDKVTAEIRYLEGDKERGRPWSPLTAEDLLVIQNRYMPQPKEQKPMGFARPIK
jgi:ATP-dependent 26S proteasome regulatory subunit